ncbi:MAG: hypothetical protein HS111_23420 [Kofleriaceae bacterium]|nr:hypothetical protein [Kofleriaceae bacterium]
MTPSPKDARAGELDAIPPRWRRGRASAVDDVVATARADASGSAIPAVVRFIEDR